MSQQRPVIVWFRHDLRLADNPALARAQATGAPVIPVYVLDETPTLRPMGAASRWWLDKSLKALSANFADMGSRLILRRGEAAQVIAELVQETGAQGVFWNRLYDPVQVDRDKGLKAELEAAGVSCITSNAALLAEPWTVKNGAGEPYKVFTPFWKALRAVVHQPQTAPRPQTLAAPATWPTTEELGDWGLHPTKPDWSGGFKAWTPGENGARQMLDAFIDHRLAAYADSRDIPARQATSRLSPHLHFGEIGPRQIWNAAQAAATRGASTAQVEKFLSELAWREFNHHLLFARPNLPDHPFKPEVDALPWRDDEAAFRAWTQGKTGYPLVDAGMRELWATGFMENRVRMVVASFLIKHLLIDWRRGEAWFWDTLLDADLANNVGNWQWVAGCGADAAPFFRIFNPVAQGEKFDPDGRYVRRWVPEIARLPNAHLHRPWAAPAEILRGCGVLLGQTYPKPMVDHDVARNRALDAYKKARA